MFPAARRFPIYEVAQKFRARLQARRASVQHDEFEFDPAYSAEVYLYIERLLCQTCLPGEQVEENVCEIYLGSALTRLENFLPANAGRIEKAMIEILKKKILEKWDELARREELKMEADRILEELLNSSKSSESSSSSETKTHSDHSDSEEPIDLQLHDISRKFEELKKAAVTLSRQGSQENKDSVVGEVEKEKIDHEMIKEDLINGVERLRERRAQLFARINRLNGSKD